MSDNNNFKPSLEGYKPLRPFNLFMKNNFPFIENTFEALDTYGLLCEIVKYLNTVIENLNTEEINIANLYVAFNQLNDYVSHYFDNLDVQEEINNKLDDMVESGTLQEIIATYLNSKAVFCFDNVEDMTESTNLIDGSYAKTLGFYSVNDGGQAIYKIRTVTNDDVVNNMNIIEMSDNNLIAELIASNYNVLQLGAKINDSTFDNSSIFNFAFNNDNKNVFIPNGTYNFNTSVTAYKSKEIRGENRMLTVLEFKNATGDGLSVGDSVQLKNLYILGTGNFANNLLVYNGIEGERSYPTTGIFENLNISTDNDIQIESMFKYIPYHNYGLNIKNINIGIQGTKRKATKGLIVTSGSDSTNWFNALTIENVIIDIQGLNIIPFECINNFSTTSSGRNIFRSVRIQHRNNANTSYLRHWHLKSLMDTVIENCNIYDYVSANTQNNPIWYEYCGALTIICCPNMFLKNVAEFSDNGNSAVYNGYNSQYNQYLEPKNQTLQLNLSDYTATQIVPIFFPANRLEGYKQFIEIEGFTRYASSGGTYGGYFELICRNFLTGASDTSGNYIRDIILKSNIFKTNPFLYKIKLYNEGIVLFIKGNNTFYLKTIGNGEPVIAVGMKLHILDSTTEETLAAETIGDSDTGIEFSGSALYYYNKKTIDYSTAKDNP